MQERRRFLQVLSSSMMVAGVGCGSSTEGQGGAGGTTSSGVGGTAGSGGDTTTTTSTTSTSTTSTTTTSGSGCVDPVGTNVGMPSQYATNGLHKVPGTFFLIGRDDNGLYARSSKCTHMSCDLNTKGVIMANGIHCNCHGAEFDNNGTATKLPNSVNALNPLPSYAVALGCDGGLVVDKNTMVAQSDRLMGV